MALLPALTTLAAILISTEASLIVGKSGPESKTLLIVTGNISQGTVIYFNPDEKLKVVIEQVDVSIGVGCLACWISAGGVGRSYVKVVIAPDPKETCTTWDPFTVEVYGRVLQRDQDVYNKNYSQYAADLAKMDWERFRRLRICK